MGEGHQKQRALVVAFFSPHSAPHFAPQAAPYCATLDIVEILGGSANLIGRQGNLRGDHVPAKH